MVLSKIGKGAMALVVMPLLVLFVGITPLWNQLLFFKSKSLTFQASTPYSPTDVLDLAAEAIQLLDQFSTTCWLTNVPLDKNDYLPLARTRHDLDTPVSRLAKGMRLYEGASIQLPPTDSNHEFIFTTMLSSIHLQMYPFPNQEDNTRAWFHALASESDVYADHRLLMAQAVLVAGISSNHGGQNSGDIRALEMAYIACLASHELVKTSNGEIPSVRTSPRRIPHGDLDSIATWVSASNVVMRSVSYKTATVLGESSDTELRSLLAGFNHTGMPPSEDTPRRRLLTELLRNLRLPLRLETNLTVSMDREKMEQDLADSVAGATPYRALSRAAAFIATAFPEYAQRDLSLGSVCEQLPNKNGSSTLLPGCGRAVEAFWGDGSDWSPSIENHRILEDEKWPFFSLLSSADIMSSAIWRLHNILQGVAVGRAISEHVGAVALPGVVEWKVSASLRKVINSPEKQGPVAGPPPGWATTFDATRCMDLSKIETTLWLLGDDTLMDLHTALEKIESAQDMVQDNTEFWHLVGSYTGRLTRVMPPSTDSPLTEPPLDRRPTFVGRFLSMLRQIAEWCGLFFLVSTIMGFLALGLSYLKKGAVAKSRGVHRPRAARNTTPASSAAALLQRTTAANALREALISDNLQKLSAAIKAAEESGVEKPLLKKARNVLHNLKKRRAAQGASPTERKSSPTGSLMPPSTTPIAIRKSSASSPLSSPATPTTTTTTSTTPTTPAEDTAANGEWTTSPRRKVSYMASFKPVYSPNDTVDTNKPRALSLPLPSSSPSPLPSPSPSPAPSKPSPIEQAPPPTTHHHPLPSSTQYLPQAQPVTPTPASLATPSSPRDIPVPSPPPQPVPMDKPQAQDKQTQAPTFVAAAFSTWALAEPPSLPVLSFTGPTKTLDESETERPAAPKGTSAPKVVLVRRTVSNARRVPSPASPVEVQEAKAAAGRALVKVRAPITRPSPPNPTENPTGIPTPAIPSESSPALSSPFNNTVCDGKPTVTTPQTPHSDARIAQRTLGTVFTTASSGNSDAPAGDWLGCEDAPLAEMWRAAALTSMNQRNLAEAQNNFSKSPIENSSLAKRSNSVPSSPPPPPTLVGSPGLGATLHGYGMAGVGQYGSAAFSPDSSLALRLPPADESMTATNSGAMSSSTSGNGSGSVHLLEMLTSLKHIWGAPAAEAAGTTAALPILPEAPVALVDELTGRELNFGPSVYGSLAALGFKDDTE